MTTYDDAIADLIADVAPPHEPTNWAAPDKPNIWSTYYGEPVWFDIGRTPAGRQTDSRWRRLIDRLLHR